MSPIKWLFGLTSLIASMTGGSLENSCKSMTHGHIRGYVGMSTCGYGHGSYSSSRSSLVVDAQFVIPPLGEHLDIFTNIRDGETDGAVYPPIQGLNQDTTTGVRYHRSKNSISSTSSASTSSCKDTYNILSLSGGGAFGAIQAGMLSDLYAKGQLGIPDVLTGISAGALNAGFLADVVSGDVGESGNWRDSKHSVIQERLANLTRLWTNLSTSRVYQRDLFRMFSRWSIYDNSALEQTIRETLMELREWRESKKNQNTFPRKRIDIPSLNRGSKTSNTHSTPTSKPNTNTNTPRPKVLIGGTNVNTQHLDVVDFLGLTEENKVDMLMASTSIPIVFPPRRVNGSLYVDGGMIADEMITEAIEAIQAIQANQDLKKGTLQDSLQDSCEPEYNIVVALAHPLEIGVRHSSPSSLSEYISSILHLLYETFNSQLSEFAYRPTIHMVVCAPTRTSGIHQYSILDFDHGAELVELGKRKYACV